MPTKDSAEKSENEVPSQGSNVQDGFATDTLHLIAGHKGKLAVGAAAALGLMILYHWREKSLAEEDPQAYAQLKKFTAPFKSADEVEQEEFERRMREQGTHPPI
ncbi:MAG: hypothetical protein Q7U14_15505 [Lacisediminimonas sp.]|nr:hypothetical protein [Lacisediminimonas sp.]